MEDMVSRVQQVLTELEILGEQHELGAMTLLPARQIKLAFSL